MKRIFYILFALIGLPLVAQAADGSAEWLGKLDKSLSNRENYEKIRVGRIDSLRNNLIQMEKKAGAKATDEYFDVMYGLYNEYKSYCYDSAHHYAQKCLTAAQLNNNAEQMVKAKNAVAFSLISAVVIAFTCKSESHNSSTLLNDSSACWYLWSRICREP